MINHMFSTFSHIYYRIVIFIIIFCIGWMAGSYLHPLEQCERKYDNPEDVAECIWIMENN